MLGISWHTLLLSQGSSQEGIITTSFYKWGSQGPEKEGNLSKVTQQSQESNLGRLTPKLNLFPIIFMLFLPFVTVNNAATSIGV